MKKKNELKLMNYVKDQKKKKKKANEEEEEEEAEVIDIFFFSLELQWEMDEINGIKLEK